VAHIQLRFTGSVYQYIQECFPLQTSLVIIILQTPSIKRRSFQKNFMRIAHSVGARRNRIYHYNILLLINCTCCTLASRTVVISWLKTASAACSILTDIDINDFGRLPCCCGPMTGRCVFMKCHRVEMVQRITVFFLFFF